MVSSLSFYFLGDKSCGFESHLGCQMLFDPSTSVSDLRLQPTPKPT